MNAARKTTLTLLTGMLLCTAAGAGTTVDLTAEASRPAANDMVRATVSAEASGSNPGELARRVNQDVAEGLKVIKARPGISIKSGHQSTFPVYSQNQKIESWRVRSELILESRDAAGVSELLGQLQQMRLVVSDVNQLPTPETRRKVEDEATREAIGAFRQRAAVVAEVLGKPYTIRHLSIHQSGQMPPMPRAGRAMVAEMAAAPPVPMEPGESLVTTTVSGQVEMAD
ncbi:MAG TPA: SIMPL domain-containing protein [Azonexus sp.]|jgi:predicted secreted protein|nr:SIMPL domain-containing protein [Azonexus sp.]